MIEWQKDKRGISLSTEVTITLADDPDLMSLMVEAGFNQVFIGIETPDHSSLVECSKVQNRNRDLIEDVKKIQRAGMQVQGGFIVGFDHDLPSIFQKQIDFIQNSGIVTAMVGLLQAFPGTRLYERLKREGRLIGFTTGDNVDGTTNFVPTMNIQALLEGYRHILGTIYAPKPYYQRVKTFLLEYNPPRIKTRIRPDDLRAFFRSILHLGILGRDRRYFWNLLIWTSLRRPRLIKEAVTLAVYGFHFRKVCLLHVR